MGVVWSSLEPRNTRKVTLVMSGGKKNCHKYLLGAVHVELTVAQPTVVPSAPRIELTIGCDRSTIRAPTGHMDHMLSSLLPIEGCNHLRFF